MDEALLSISPAGRVQLVKIIIILEPHGLLVFELNFSYLYILTLFSDWYAVARLRRASFWLVDVF